MNAPRLFYRTQQFFQALAGRSGDQELEQANRLLSPKQWGLFSSLHPSEQSHSLRILRQLQAEGEADPDLLAAALLHDVGKIHFPLHLWERVWIVLAHAFAPTWARKIGAGSLPADRNIPAWRKALMAASQHPQWGADLAAQADCSNRVVELIRRHQEPPIRQPQNKTELLLQKLQEVDNKA